ncbi:MAG: putative nicotinate-nucleotide adenylyltransferase [bacterium]|nr:MAG: putative nicotinate-nucleotide adenylyltransferase [bacterium]
MKVGLISGVFDPIHIGHLNMANHAADILKLEKVYFVPTGLPPHKKKAAAQTRDRFTMAQLAIMDNPLFEASDTEIKGSSPSYSVETVEEFKKTFKGGLYFIMGLDAFEDIHNWKSAARLLKSCHFAVMPRPGADMKKSTGKLEKSFGAKQIGISFKRRESGAGGDVLRVSGSTCDVHLCSAVQMDISSTMIRKKVKRGESIKYLVPAAVEQYIISMGLYEK